MIARVMNRTWCALRQKPKVERNGEALDGKAKHKKTAVLHASTEHTDEKEHKDNLRNKN
jgi:hypothetical protein